MSINPVELYTLSTIDFDSISEDDCKDEVNLKNFFWAPNKLLIEKLELWTKNLENIIDVGCGIGNAIFPKANYLVGKDLLVNQNNLKFIDLDLDFDKFPQNDQYFDFIYCRHTLEDIQNPQNAFAELIRIGKKGYIETPSPLIEITKGAENGNVLRGYHHHRYIVWSDQTTNTLYFLPKYPIIEILNIPDILTKKINYLLNNLSVYWNNYYFWDNLHKPNIVVYRNEFNLSILKDYGNLITTAIFKSIEYTNHFINKMKE